MQEKERGPVKVVLRVEPREPTFADRIQFSIAARAQPGVEVALPSPGENLGEFLIRDFLRLPRKTTPEGLVESGHAYVLEVLTSGEYTIPELTISFVDNRDAPDAAPGTAPGAEPVPPAAEEETFRILTDPIAIRVRSLEDPGALADLRPIAGPVEPPSVLPGFKWPLIAAGVLAAAAALAFLALRLFKRARAAAPPPPPEEIAYRELEWLLAQGFAARGELKEFYFHLSRIVREYIERRFGLRAPERTTEEFLEELARSDALAPEHRPLLSQFLERADLVKFARYAPRPEEIESSFEAAKEFIGATRPRAEGAQSMEAAGAAR